MNKIVLDSNCKNDFMIYAMNRARSYLLPLIHFKEENVSALYDSYTNNKTYCNDRGEFWLNGEKCAYMVSRITFLVDCGNYKAGDMITNPDEIITCENNRFRDDFYAYREDNLFHNIWCEIEKILRCGYYK